MISSWLPSARILPSSRKRGARHHDVREREALPLAARELLGGFFLLPHPQVNLDLPGN